MGGGERSSPGSKQATFSILFAPPKGVKKRGFRQVSTSHKDIRVSGGIHVLLKRRKRREKLRRIDVQTSEPVMRGFHH